MHTEHCISSYTSSPLVLTLYCMKTRSLLILNVLFVSSELMKEDYSEIQHKKSEVFHLCNYCTQILEKTEQMWVSRTMTAIRLSDWKSSSPVSLDRFEVLMQANMSTEYDEISDMHKKVLRVSIRFTPRGVLSWTRHSKKLFCSLVSQVAHSSYCCSMQHGHGVFIRTWRFCENFQNPSDISMLTLRCFYRV